MKKILVLLGSCRKNGTGYTFVKSTLEKTKEKGIEIEFLNLSDYNIKPCIGCTVCFKKEEEFCPCRDDILDIVMKMKEADGIVLVSPVYERSVSGLMKVFFDRTCFLIHRPAIFGKLGINVAVADLAGAGSTLKLMDVVTGSWGVRQRGSFGVLAVKYRNDESYRKKIEGNFERVLKNFQEELLDDKVQKPRFRELAKFNLWKIKNRNFKEIYPYDYKYWEKNGWFQSYYYYDVKLSFIKRSLLNIMTVFIQKILIKRTGL